MIHISLSPNLESDDRFEAINQIKSPLRWRETKYQQELTEKLFKLYPKASGIYLFNSGRSALMIGLAALNLPPRSRVLLQSLTCSAVPNSIIWNRLIPTYCDINEKTYNLDVHKLPEITRNTKAILLQHTFGSPADIKKIASMCDKNNLFLIEDCAHSFGAFVGKSPIGSFGDISILSFGRDKIISSVFGGALIVNNPYLLESVENIYFMLKYPGLKWTTEQLLHPIITYYSLQYYSKFNIGKAILVGAQKLRLLSKAVYKEEHEHIVPEIFPGSMPEPLAALASRQFDKLERFNKHRVKIAQIYDKFIKNPNINKPQWETDSVYLRYSILSSQRDKLIVYLKKNNVIAGDWYRTPIYPSKNPRKVWYLTGMAPIAEKVSSQIVNLPTSPNMTNADAHTIVNLINKWSP